MQQVLFDEVPLAPMLVYPNDWNNDAIWRLLLNDFGDRMVAAVAATWTLTANPAAKSGSVFSSASVAIGAGLLGAASYVYAGYGFQFWSIKGPAAGIGALSLDGTFLANVDFYAANNLLQPNVSSMLFQQQNVPLGIHTVTLTATGTKNAASSGYAVNWDALKVMR
jgi:hypothetical protein